MSALATPVIASAATQSSPVEAGLSRRLRLLALTIMGEAE